MGRPRELSLLILKHRKNKCVTLGIIDCVATTEKTEATHVCPSQYMLSFCLPQHTLSGNICPGRYRRIYQQSAILRSAGLPLRLGSSMRKNLGVMTSGCVSFHGVAWAFVGPKLSRIPRCALLAVSGVCSPYRYSPRMS